MAKSDKDPTPWNLGHQPGPGDPEYIDMETFLRHEVQRRTDYNSRPDVVAKRLDDAEARKRRQLERNGKRKRPTLIQTIDYPWLKPDRVEAPVRPFKRR